MTRQFRFGLIIVLTAAMAAAAFAQVPSNIGNIGPSGVQIAGAIAGVAAVTGVVLYFTLRKPSITGCIESVDGATRLTNEKDKRTYALASDHLDLKVGDRVQLKGKKAKGKNGNLTFDVKKVSQDYGPCK